MQDYYFEMNGECFRPSVYVSNPHIAPIRNTNDNTRLVSSAWQIKLLARPYAMTFNWKILTIWGVATLYQWEEYILVFFNERVTAQHVAIALGRIVGEPLMVDASFCAFRNHPSSCIKAICNARRPFQLPDGSNLLDLNF